MRSSMYRYGGILVLATAMLSACGQATEEDLTFKVTFDSNGGSAVASQTVKYGEKAKKPTNPTKAAHTFDKWYADAACKVAFDFTVAITANWTLYAGWKVGGGDASDTSTPVSSDTSSADAGFTMVFVDASWWNGEGVATNYTFSPADDGKGTTIPTDRGAYLGYNETTRQCSWEITVPAGKTKIQFFRVGWDNNNDYGARTVVIDLNARNGKTKWALADTTTWYGPNNSLASGTWVD